MGHALDVLLDDRALIKISRDEVRRRTDELDPAGKRLAIGARALEAGQERVVDVDRPAGDLRAELIGEHLHVAGEHDDIDAVLGNELEQPGLLRRLGLGSDRQVQVWDPGSSRDLGAIRVVRHDERDVDLKLAELVSVEEIDETVVELRDHDQRPTAVLLVAQGDRRSQVRGGIDDRPSHLREIVRRCLEAGPQAEVIGRAFGELRLLEDVRTDREQRSGDGVGDAGAVGAAEGKDVGGHDHRVCRLRSPRSTRRSPTG